MTSLLRCSLAAMLPLFFVASLAPSFAFSQPQDAGAGPATSQPQDAGAGPATAEPVDGVPVSTGETPETGTEGEAAGVPPDPNLSPPSDGLKEASAPVTLRLRALEQRVQALKERAWRAKARVGMLKEAVLGGGVGARASIKHVNKMGNSYRLVKLVYALDGTQIFARNDTSGTLHSESEFDILTGPITPGSHTISVLAQYRGHGYGVFKYLKKYKFTVRSSHTFTASEGKGTGVNVVAFERGGVTTPLEKRPAFDFKVNVVSGTKGE